jgi:uncharacterized membrane protein
MIFPAGKIYSENALNQLTWKTGGEYLTLKELIQNIMPRKLLNLLLAVMAVIVGLYPAIYFFADRQSGLLSSKTDAVLSGVFWNIGFYTHIMFGGLALLIGWTQFNPGWRTRRLRLHRQVGKVYVIASLLSALAGVYIALYATGGLVAAAGFSCLGISWFYTTLAAYRQIRKGNIEAHQKMMIYSYAACFSAVTLRVYLPFLIMLFHDFIKAYLLVAWLCWIPNLLVAWLIVKQFDRHKEAAIITIDNAAVDEPRH